MQRYIQRVPNLVLASDSEHHMLRAARTLYHAHSMQR
uniref:Uncharacterized protein n=1 Tax=Arundo donax TaxID=35708 RepID=A0A0A9GU58_ARUDO